MDTSEWWLRANLRMYERNKGLVRARGDDGRVISRASRIALNLHFPRSDSPIMSPEPPLFIVETPSPRDLQRFFDQLSSLLADELAAEQARTALLSTNCSWDVLAERGLAINSLGVSNVAVGLGGKRSVYISCVGTESRRGS